MRLRLLVNIILALGLSIGGGLLARHVNQGNCHERAVDAVLTGGTLTLSSNCQLTLQSTKTITGDVTLRGGTLTGNMQQGMLVIEAQASLRLHDVRLAGAKPALFNHGNLILSKVTLQYNSEGIVNHGTLRMNESAILDSSCRGCNGAALFNSGDAILEASVLRRNSALPDPAKRGAPAGGAVFNRGHVTLSQVIISHSRAGVGGAIFNLGRMDISESTLYDNEIYALSDGIGHGGAVDNHGTLSIVNSRLERNTTYHMGGAVNNHEALFIANSIIADNRCTSRTCAGAAVYNFSQTGTAQMINNYWGRVDHPRAVIHGLDEASYTPYLEEPPSWAR